MHPTVCKYLFDEISEVEDIVESLQVRKKIFTEKHVTTNNIPWQQLKSIVDVVMATEKTWNFQYQLWLEKQSLANAMNLWLNSFDLWQYVAGHPVFTKAITNNFYPKVFVMGSSVGLLPFYTSFIYPKCHCIGYEVLPMLFEKHPVRVLLRWFHHPKMICSCLRAWRTTERANQIECSE